MADNTDFNDFSAEAKVTAQVDGSAAGETNEESRLNAVAMTVFSGDPPTQRARPQTDILIDVGLNVSKALFCGDDDRPYAVIRDRSEVWLIASRRFREWLRGCYFTRVGRGANRNSVQDAVETIASKAQFSGNKRKVFLRTAEADGKLYIDMTDDGWRVIEIDGKDWQVLDHSPVMFTRRGSPAPLPVPERGGSLSALWPLLNVPEKYRPLAAGWLVAALRPSGPYPILLFQGKDGTAKSTVARILRFLSDPSLVPLRPPTRDERDFLVGAVSNWCVCIDNVSGLQPWMSDALCRLSTGGGFAARLLYTDCDELAIQIQRPVILNGIDVGAVRGDLLSRIIAVPLSPIPEDQRLPEEKMWSQFQEAAPPVFGALLTALSQAVRDLPTVTLQRHPRMADFARLVVAVETALGFDRGAFMAAYQENLTEGDGGDRGVAGGTGNHRVHAGAPRVDRDFKATAGRHHAGVHQPRVTAAARLAAVRARHIRGTRSVCVGLAAERNLLRAATKAGPRERSPPTPSMQGAGATVHISRIGQT